MKLDAVVGSTLAACAIVMTAMVVRREIFVPARSVQGELKAQFIRDWNVDLNHGVAMGEGRTPVQIMEFADFECSFCSEFHKTLKSVEEHYPNRIGLTYVHFPIPGHRFAQPAARVA